MNLSASPDFRWMCFSHLMQLNIVNTTLFTVDLPETLTFALGKMGLNIAEVGTFQNWNFFEVSIPPCCLIPPLPSPSLCLPLFLLFFFSFPLLILSSPLFVSCCSFSIKTQLIVRDSARHICEEVIAVTSFLAMLII